MASFRKRGDRWQVQVRLKDRKPISRSFRLKADAETWAVQTEAALMGQPSDSNPTKTGMTLGEALIRYKNSVSPAKRGHPAEVYLLRTLKAHPLADTFLHQLTPAGVASLRDDRLKLVSPRRFGESWHYCRIAFT